MKLEEYERGTIRPHERTLAKPKEDRLALLSATKADLELLFLLTRAPLSAALSTRRAPNLTATDDDGVRHDAFRISDYAAHVELQGLVKNAESIIADGHHRYETALAFSKDPATEKMPGAKYKLCAIVDMESPGVIVRPIHRLLSGMPDCAPSRRCTPPAITSSFASSVRPGRPTMRSKRTPAASPRSCSMPLRASPCS